MTEETGQAGAEIEVTPAMMEAGMMEAFEVLDGEDGGVFARDLGCGSGPIPTMEEAMARIYRAMTAAAPSRCQKPAS